MTSRRSLLSAGAALLAILASGQARADITPKFSAADCRSNMFDQPVYKQGDPVGTFLIDTAAKTIKNTSAGTSRVECPIQMRTSGLDANGGVITTDGIVSVAIPVKTAAQVNCSVETRFVPIAENSNATPNVVGFPFTGTRSTVGTLTISLGSSRPKRYWDAGALQAGKPAWYYSYLSCNLAPGAQIGEYTVTEAGAATGYTIDPMISCPLASDMHWRWVDFVTEPTGHYLAQAFGSLKLFTLACPVPQNASVQVAMSGGSFNPAGCNLNSSSFSTITWPGSSSQWPTEVLSGAYQPVIATPLAQTNTLYCGQNTTSGDSRWFSYRVIPNLSHVGKWTVSASHNSGAASSAIDANTGTRWSSNTAGKAGMTYTVDLGASWTGEFNQVTFDSGSDPDDYPRKFSVLTSYDGINFSPITQFTANNHFATANFSEQAARWFQIRVDQDIKNAAGATKYWSIRELNIYFNNGQ
jgi:F5/8 type C domain